MLWRKEFIEKGETKVPTAIIFIIVATIYFGVWIILGIIFKCFPDLPNELIDEDEISTMFTFGWFVMLPAVLFAAFDRINLAEKINKKGVACLRSFLDRKNKQEEPNELDETIERILEKQRRKENG